MAMTSCLAHNRDWSVKTIKLRAAAARSKGDPVRIGTGHSSGTWTDISLASDTNLYRVAVALESAASGDVYEAAVQGTVDVTVPSGTYTAGNGVKVQGGALADTATAATAYDDLAANISLGCIAVGGTTVTSIKVTLTGDRITATV